MPEVENRFRITDESDEYLWLRLDQDQESGLEVPVPKDSPKYTSQIREALRHLEKTTTITATLVSENEDNTAWRIKDIEQVNSHENSVTALV